MGDIVLDSFDDRYGYSIPQSGGKSKMDLDFLHIGIGGGESLFKLDESKQHSPAKKFFYFFRKCKSFLRKNVSIAIEGRVGLL